ncbi:DUF502 domain-containing protein [Persephonella sp.]|uniref:DUF502 domain-containing protein n=1 Tax=Persephonella sp. TaxID=2060922 RepID=UPI0025EFCF80|nr:DUF502 domain-containing protein [Persephonella sp.]
MNNFRKKILILKIRDTFLTGLFVFIPIAITIWIVVWLLSFVNNLVLPYLRYLIPIPDIPGVGILVTLLIVFATGLIAQNYFGKKLISLWDSLINRIPLVRSIYIATKQLMENLFNSKGKGKFKEAVLVEFPRKGMLSIGFVANKIQFDGKTYYLVYIPTAPNPTSGYTIFVEENEVRHTDLTVEEATKIILSGGLVSKNKIKPL